MQIAHPVLFAALSLVAGGASAQSSAPAVVSRDAQPTAIVRGPISQDLFAVRVTGKPTNRVNLVFIGDGYHRTELGAWAAHVDDMVQRLLSGESPPYERYANFLNIYRVDLASAQSGVDDPGSGFYVDTALDGCNCCEDWRIGKCQVDWNKTHTAIDAATPGIPVHWRLVALNTPLFIGGAHYPARGNLAVYSTRNALTFNILTHEAGHAFHLLQDEYVNAPYLNNHYTGGEPSAVNLTADPARRKWAEWVGFSQPSLGPVGYHEGGMAQYGRSIWRPSPQSRMNNFRFELDAIGKERAIQSIYEVVDPIDEHGPRLALVPADATLWVRVVDPAVLRVEWTLDAQVVGTGARLDLSQLTIQPGLHLVEAHVRDLVLDHAFSNNQNPHPLDLVRRGDAELSQTVSWAMIAH